MSKRFSKVVVGRGVELNKLYPVGNIILIYDPYGITYLLNNSNLYLQSTKLSPFLLAVI